MRHHPIVQTEVKHFLGETSVLIQHVSVCVCVVVAPDDGTHPCFSVSRSSHLVSLNRSWLSHGGLTLHKRDYCSVGKIT